MPKDPKAKGIGGVRTIGRKRSLHKGLLYLLEKRMAQEGAGTWSAEKGEERLASPCAPNFQNPAAYTSPSSAPLLPSSAQPAKQPELLSLAS